jgi:hypothetical protein
MSENAQTMNIVMEPPPFWWVRFKPGTVGLTKRTTHTVPIPVGFPNVLTAYCGQEIGQGEAEIVEPFTGQPCDLCLLRIPLPDEPLQPSGAKPLLQLLGPDDG